MRRPWSAAGLLLLLGARVATAGELPRFFVMGDGRLAFENVHTGVRVDARYRGDDGAYDAEAIARLRRAFRSKGDESEGRMSLRLIEVLSRLQHASGVRVLRLVSGYRSPEYNAALRQRGAKAAGGSLHTDGLAADVAFPPQLLRRLWRDLRALDCCGAGYYAKEKFLHVDVGRPRFWEPRTSRVDENLSAGNARVFARTEFDRYAPGEAIVVTLHALTVPPLRIARTARLVEGESSVPATLAGGDGDAGDCLEVRGAPLRAVLDGRLVAGRLELATCPPRVERTPAVVTANRIEAR